MDHIRQDLNELMGKDRNHPLHIRLKKRDHFDDNDVCKYNLISFCPHDLFPNTKADLGACKKRHDEFFKDMFKSDSNKEYYQRKYEQELIELLQSMIGQVDQKIKRSLQRIEQPIPDHLNIPEMNQYQQETAQNRIDQLEQKINFYVEKAEKLGEEGKLEEFESLMKEVERLKQQKLELEALSDNTILPKEKNMKVCEICGALQATTDTDKRLFMHLEGKLHTGYQKIRKVLNELLQKKEEYKRMKEKERSGRGGRRSRSRTQSPPKFPLQYAVQGQKSNNNNNKNEKVESQDKFEDHFYFSSRKFGSGANIPSEDDLHQRYADIAITCNRESMAPTSFLADTVKLGKEWGYYKRNIDKQKKEEKEEKKREEERLERRFDHRGGGERSGDGGHRRQDFENRGDRGDRGDRGGERGDYRRGGFGGESRGGYRGGFGGGNNPHYKERNNFGGGDGERDYNRRKY